MTLSESLEAEAKPPFPSFTKRQNIFHQTARTDLPNRDAARMKHGSEADLEGSGLREA